ncbi:tyrosine-type recombinase/integrase [Streptomyces albus]|uniref:tyrosine-type recombinase/integrase n=1 Tax=Streptomyces sp. NRRL F-5917 TaxID=1463873 RepID=UPI0004BF2557|nr:site-specific integrase [Streptomyces sp. NRRL F-5917]
MGDPIKRIVLKDGTVRWRTVVDAGLTPEGKRKQITITRSTKTEAEEERARIIHQRRRGTLVIPSKLTVAELVDMWLEGVIPDVEQKTARSYIDAMAYVKKHLGVIPVQQLTEDHVTDMVTWMLTSARRIGGKPGTGLGARTVELTLGRLRAVLTLGIRRQYIERNVAQYVTVPKEARKAARAKRRERKPWNEAEVRQFLTGIRETREFGGWMLTFIAERPAEVCGARWAQDIDLENGTTTIGNTRTLTYDPSRPLGERSVVVEKDAKTEAGERALPLPLPTWIGLKAFRSIQATERAAAGAAYEDSGYVMVDELGRPWKTDKLRREAYKLMDATGVRRVRLYDARHAVLSWMANNGVPDTVVSAWAGHTDLSFTKRIYVHPDPQSLKAGSDKLGELLG